MSGLVDEMTSLPRLRQILELHSRYDSKFEMTEKKLSAQGMDISASSVLLDIEDDAKMADDEESELASGVKQLAVESSIPVAPVGGTGGKGASTVNINASAQIKERAYQLPLRRLSGGEELSKEEILSMADEDGDENANTGEEENSSNNAQEGANTTSTSTDNEVNTASATPSNGVEVDSSISVPNSTDIDDEIAKLQNRLERANDRKYASALRRTKLARDMYQLSTYRDNIQNEVNELQRTHTELRQKIRQKKVEHTALKEKLERFMQINALNDCFYVWFTGPYGTINNFRLGNIPYKSVEWMEINTAIGEIAAALAVVTSKLSYEEFHFTKYRILPMGAFSKVYKIDTTMLEKFSAMASNREEEVVSGGFGRALSMAEKTVISRYAAGKDTVVNAASNRRFSFFGIGSSANSSTSTNNKSNRGTLPSSKKTSDLNTKQEPLTQEELVQQETSRKVHNMAIIANKHIEDPLLSTIDKRGIAVNSVQNLYAFPEDVVPTFQNLYLDLNYSTFTLFPKSKFNSALYGLMCCVYEVGEYIRQVDAPLCLPYRIDIGDESGRTCKIVPSNPSNRSNNQPLDLFWSGNTNNTTSNEQDEQWTRALKFVLADIKWIIAWATRRESGEKAEGM